MTEHIEMDKSQLNELLDIVSEHDKNARDYKVREKTGNSKGELKDFYRAKAEVHERSSLLLRRFLRWRGYISE